MAKTQFLYIFQDEKCRLMQNLFLSVGLIFIPLMINDSFIYNYYTLFYLQNQKFIFLQNLIFEINTEIDIFLMYC